MERACVVCGTPSDQARCPEHRYTRDRSPAARAQRQRIIERDGHRCQRCGTHLTGARDTHVDHVIPLSKGGDETDLNKVTLCGPCNLRKGST